MGIENIQFWIKFIWSDVNVFHALITCMVLSKLRSLVELETVEEAEDTTNVQ